MPSGQSQVFERLLCRVSRAYAIMRDELTLRMGETSHSPFNARNRLPQGLCPPCHRSEQGFRTPGKLSHRRAPIRGVYRDSFLGEWALSRTQPFVRVRWLIDRKRSLLPELNSPTPCDRLRCLRRRSTARLWSSSRESSIRLRT